MARLRTMLAVLLVAAGLAGYGEGARAQETRIATFAGGCFWCLEADFDRVPGVLDTVSGYIGGTMPNPTYELVVLGITGHTEAVQVTYDPAKVTFERLLEVFWHSIDPLDARGQFCDKGSQYRTGIFYHDAAQQKAALDSKRTLEASGRFKKPIVTEITAATTFTRAEEYHQDFHRKNPTRYFLYRKGCRRDARLEELWGKPTN